MTVKQPPVLFEGRQIRRHWDNKKELWYFSVSDVIAVLTKSVDPVVYWRKLKERLRKEGGNETVTKCHALKMIAPDGKMRLTDAADTETMLRLIQSIPSPNAEPSQFVMLNLFQHLWRSQISLRETIIR